MSLPTKVATSRVVWDKTPVVWWEQGLDHVEWHEFDPPIAASELCLADEMLRRARYSIHVLSTFVVIDPETRGGVPVLIGTRFPVSRLFAEVASGRSIGDIADDKELDLAAIESIFKAFASNLGRSFCR